MRKHISRLVLVASCSLSLIAIPAGSAAQRVVVMEDFMGVNCYYCQFSAPAIHQLADEHPNTLVVIGIHAGGFSLPAHQTPWGNTRNSYYAITGYPTVWIDGVSRVVGAGSVSSAYFNYNQIYQSRVSAPTDVTVAIGAEEQIGGLYRATARVRVEPTGQQRNLRLHLLQVLDNWPVSSSYGFISKNTVRAAMTPVDFVLQPGQTNEVSWEWQIAPFDLATPQNVRLIAVVQQSTTRTIFQGAQMSFPFVPLPPAYTRGDMDCDGSIDFDDINGFVLAMISQSSYGTAYPDCEYFNADCNGDGLVNFADIDAFILALVGA
jgi:thiol-disulfide isomerase/thioredoxin